MTIKTLHEHFLECNHISTDTRNIKEGALFFALKGDNFNANLFAEDALKKGAKYAVIDDANYKSSDKMILVDNALKTLQDLALYHRNYLNLPVIALTGSNGKTTTKELIHAVLSQSYNTTATKGNLNNHIGVPLTLLSMTKETEIGIVEMGANHQKEIDFLCGIAKPDFGYITNFGKAHLEGFGSIEGVIKGKSELYKHIVKHDKLLFVNKEDELQIKHSENAKTYTFGHKDVDVPVHKTKYQPFVEISFDDLLIRSKLIGDYNYNNIAAAICIGNYFKIGSVKIKNAIEHYVPTNNRSQIVQKETNEIILDAYNANPSSMTAALLNLHNLKRTHKIAILGDMFELGKEAQTEHQAIANYASSLNINKIILVGENFNKITSTSSEKISIFNSFSELKNNFSPIKNATLLIKGSRGMALERLLEFI